MTDTPQDRPSLSIFDNAGTGGFHVRSRGYDREQVERYVRKLEDKLREATARGAERAELLARAEERVGELSGEVTSLRARVEAAEGKLRAVDQPSFAGLGEHVATLLASAEEQAAQLKAAALADSERMRAEADAAAAQTRQQAHDHADQMRREAEEHRRQVTDAAARLTAETEAEAARMRHEAGSDATAARVQAVEQSRSLLDDAQRAVAALRAAADADAEAQREAAATLLHEARQRADHQVGAVSSGLVTLQQRLQSLGGTDAGPAASEPAAEEPPATADDPTQLFPAAGS